jgi:S-adenosylmethionine synthetase
MPSSTSTDRNSLDITLPTILHFSSQSKVYSKLDMSNFLASCLGIDNAADFLVPVREGPKEGETRRPRDCHLSNGALEELGIDTREEETFEQWFRRELS